MKLRTIINRIRWFKINHIYAGTSHFEKKRRLLIKLGFKIGENTKIVAPIHCDANLVIGDNCWIGRDLSIYGNGEVIIGDNCDIGPSVSFFTGSHNVGSAKRRAGDGFNCKQAIGSGTWVGGNSAFINDVDIGCGCVIGASSLVNKSFPSAVMICGVPAKIKKEINENVKNTGE